MGNSRLILTNKVFTSGALLNGTGGGSIPAREETSPYLMENAMRAGRKTLWQTSSSVASPTYFDLDLGSALSVNCAAICGLRSSATMAACDVQWATSYYPGAWTTADSISLSATPRDAGVVFSGGSVSKRYWRFSITGGGQFSISSLWLGVLVDLGGMHSPDAITTPFRNRLEQGQQDGSIITNDLGDNGHDFTLPFNVANTSLRTSLQAISSVSGSFVYIDPDDGFYEVIARGGRVDTRRTHSNTIYGLSTEFARLP